MTFNCFPYTSISSIHVCYIQSTSPFQPYFKSISSYVGCFESNHLCIHEICVGRSLTITSLFKL